MKPYMEEYHLTPDEPIAKDFRMIQSSRRLLPARQERMDRYGEGGPI